MTPGGRSAADLLLLAYHQAFKTHSKLSLSGNTVALDMAFGCRELPAAHIPSALSSALFEELRRRCSGQWYARSRLSCPVHADSVLPPRSLQHAALGRRGQQLSKLSDGRAPCVAAAKSSYFLFSPLLLPAALAAPPPCCARRTYSGGPPAAAGLFSRTLAPTLRITLSSADLSRQPQPLPLLLLLVVTLCA